MQLESATRNRFTLLLLKQHSELMSLAMKRRGCGWDDNYLLEVNVLELQFSVR